MNIDPIHGWHLKKEIQVGHIITSLVIAASVILYVNKIEQRLAVVEEQLRTQHERDNRQDAASAERFELLRSWLNRMDGKLDRLIEAKR